MSRQHDYEYERRRYAFKESLLLPGNLKECAVPGASNCRLGRTLDDGDLSNL